MKMNKKIKFDEELLKKLKLMDKKEQEDFYLSLPREKGAEYKEICIAVDILEDLYYTLSKLPKEAFNSEFIKKIIEFGGRPEDRLKDYIILEIKKFYELAFHEKRYALPKIPEYWIKLKDIRDKRIAHPVKEKEFKSNKEIAKLYLSIDEIGLDKIVEDFKKYAEECLNIICDY
jgi:hypothetical protein